MKLLITLPGHYLNEKRYILKLIFEYWLGLDYQLHIGKHDHYVITLLNDCKPKRIEISDVFFKGINGKWLSPKSLPTQPLNCYNLNDYFLPYIDTKSIPLIYSEQLDNGAYVHFSDEIIKIYFDIFGSVFFMLTRYEELVKQDRDEHNRFPAKASLAYQENFLDRPIVNEYIELLKQCMNYLWPNLKMKNRLFNMNLTHDVDSPFKYTSESRIKKFYSLRGIIYDSRSVLEAKNRLLDWLMVNNGAIERDPHFSFNYIMDLSEKYNLVSTFFFQSSSKLERERKYTLSNILVRNLLVLIHKRGHTIGLHPGYDTMHNSARIAEEFRCLLKVCTELGIDQKLWGGRQHFLRWAVPHTWQNYEDAGLDYDSTLGYADCVGFRSGTCYDYPVFNLITGEELSITEKPLLIMDGSLLFAKYMGLDLSESFNQAKKLIDACKYYGGLFTLLWHNTMLNCEELNELYNAIVEYGAK